MSEIFKQLVQFLRNFFDFGAGSGWNGLWNGQGRLAQHPQLPRSAQQPESLGNYSGSVTRGKRPKFSGAEVKRVLQGLEQGERARLIMSQAALIGSLLDERMVKLFPGRERIFEKLPFVVQQYSMGRPALEIARCVSYFADGDDVEELVDFACRIIANQLNRLKY